MTNEIIDYPFIVRRKPDNSLSCLKIESCILNYLFQDGNRLSPISAQFKCRVNKL